MKKLKEKKMNIKKVLTVFLVLCLTLTLFVACNSGQNVDKIFLSKSEVVLGVGETIDLIATVSPNNSETTLTWSSSNNSVAGVNNRGTVTAKAEGVAVIKVESPNGVVAVCSVEVKLKTGSIEGMVTYKYNYSRLDEPDTDTDVLLVSKSVTSLPDLVPLLILVDLPDGCYATTVDTVGNYRFDNIPAGEYYIVLISDNTNSGSSDGAEYWGSAVYSMFSEEGKKRADNNCFLHKIKSTTITVTDGKTTTFSHNFGFTNH